MSQSTTIKLWTEQLLSAGDNIDHAIDLLELMQQSIDEQQKFVDKHRIYYMYRDAQRTVKHELNHG
tara:strand:- start:134 stop:331 length:198 start_codon:yes stop_codon:yes gene_type:complete